MVVIWTRSCDAFLSNWVCVCVVHIFSILLFNKLTPGAMTSKFSC